MSAARAASGGPPREASDDLGQRLGERQEHHRAERHAERPGAERQRGTSEQEPARRSQRRQPVRHPSGRGDAHYRGALGIPAEEHKAQYQCEPSSVREPALPAEPLASEKGPGEQAVGVRVRVREPDDQVCAEGVGDPAEHGGRPPESQRPAQEEGAERGQGQLQDGDPDQRVPIREEHADPGQWVERRALLRGEQRPTTRYARRPHRELRRAQRSTHLELVGLEHVCRVLEQRVGRLGALPAREWWRLEQEVVGGQHLAAEDRGGEQHERQQDEQPRRGPPELPLTRHRRVIMPDITPAAPETL